MRLVLAESNLGRELHWVIIALIYSALLMVLFGGGALLNYKVVDYAHKIVNPHPFFYNDTDIYQSFTSPVGDAHLARKLNKFNNLGFGTMAMVVTEKNFSDKENQELIYKKLGISSRDKKVFIFVVDKIQSVDEIDISLVVGSDLQKIIDYDQEKYILYTLLRDSIMQDGNSFKAFNQAINYTVTQLAGQELATSFIAMNINDENSRSNVKLFPGYETRSLINLGTVFCLFMIIFARMAFAFISNGGVLFKSHAKSKQSSYQKFYSENFNSLKVIWWLLMGTRLLGGFAGKGGGTSGGGGAGGKW
ncbi:MAG: hypothetical protein O3C63_07010 [Cyanobacteria bacterium]|nr:hypothetical protein [Cyanobacteriota bacterium]MDA1021678.1 hypothetical protein [Cyanobacteriota bacterium]